MGNNVLSFFSAAYFSRRMPFFYGLIMNQPFEFHDIMLTEFTSLGALTKINTHFFSSLLTFNTPGTLLTGSKPKFETMFATFFVKSPAEKCSGAIA